MEAARSSETSVNFYQTTQSNISEKGNARSYHGDHFKSHENENLNYFLSSDILQCVYLLYSWMHLYETFVYRSAHLRNLFAAELSNVMAPRRLRRIKRRLLLVREFCLATYPSARKCASSEDRVTFKAPELSPMRAPNSLAKPQHLAYSSSDDGRLRCNFVRKQEVITADVPCGAG
jgi:hypothetical protein